MYISPIHRVVQKACFKYLNTNAHKYARIHSTFSSNRFVPQISHYHQGNCLISSLSKNGEIFYPETITRDFLFAPSLSSDKRCHFNLLELPCVFIPTCDTNQNITATWRAANFTTVFGFQWVKRATVIIYLNWPSVSLKVNLRGSPTVLEELSHWSTQNNLLMSPTWYPFLAALQTQENYTDSDLWAGVYRGLDLCQNRQWRPYQLWLHSWFNGGPFKVMTTLWCQTVGCYFFLVSFEILKA